MMDPAPKSVASPGRRAASYWFIDGLPDIVFGLTLLLCGATALLWRIYAPHPWLYDFWLFAAANLLFWWKCRVILDFLKARLTYPRTGYAQPPGDFDTHASLTSLSLNAERPADENVTYFMTRTVMVIFFMIYLSFNPDPPRLLAPVVMAAMAVVLYAPNRNLERPFHWGSTLLLALTGLVFLWVRVPPFVQPLLAVLLTGAWFTGQGMYTLAEYLRANPAVLSTESKRA